MGEKAVVRSPKQARSIQTKEKILDTAYRMICTKGYFNTTTNEIAKEAGIPIGSFYAYFRDKDSILMEILHRYHQAFNESTADVVANLEVYQEDKRAWIRYLIESLIRMHEVGRELNRELQVLCYYKPEVAEIMKENQEDSRRKTLDYFSQASGDIHVEDIEAAAIVVFDTISTVVDRIVFGECTIDRERIIRACIEEVYKYLMG